MNAVESSIEGHSSLPSWKANLQLDFTYRNNKTFLTNKQHHGPLLVQRPFYPEDNKCCHVYIIHPPGGIVGGDALNIQSTLSNNTHALITTPAATKFYRTNGLKAKQVQIINMQEKATLEWLPQETVFFNQTQAETTTRINIKPDSQFIAWEIQCYGFPANQLAFNQGECVQKLEIWQDKTPLLLEANRITGGDKIIDAPWGLHSHQAVGTMVFSCAQVDSIKELLQTPKFESVLTAFTHVHDFMIVRALSTYAEEIKNLFIDVWKQIRLSLIGIQPCPPRIWNT